MNKKQKIYCIGIGGIGVSALARYYLSAWYEVFGSDMHESELISKLIAEWCDILIGTNSEKIDSNFEKVIYSEAVPKNNEELLKAKELWISCQKYSEALGEVVNEYNLITVSGTHGKSTTTSMIAQIMKYSGEDFKAIIWTLLKELDGKNFYSHWEAWFFVIEACEYKEHFLSYKPLLAVITNIEYDHADYFKTPHDYVKAYEKFIANIRVWGFCILSGEEENSKKLVGQRNDIHYIEVFQNNFKLHPATWNNEHEVQVIDFPEIVLHIPWTHILYDAKLAYIVSHMIWVSDKLVLESLENYSGVWRRMEKIWKTIHNNLLISDYGHHPTEVQVTLKSLKEANPQKEIICIFQPHQYSRTIELLDWFTQSFHNCDTLIVPNIYESRDSEEDKKNMSAEKFLKSIQHPNSILWNGLENTKKIIEKIDRENEDSCIFILLWAWDVDTLRYQIKTTA